ncbi:hypothetical protein B2J88_52240 [Rhodococcus sp. SRB_17]|nr:hypothetical protein [Rhodococcus sp. SRB_17]
MTGGSWRKKAMVWPLISGAVYGIYAVWQLSSPSFSSRLLAIVTGTLYSLPAGALLGVVAILVGHTVLAFIPRQTVDHRLIGWRLAFGAAIGVAVALVVVLALMWRDFDWDPSTFGAVATIAAIAFATSCMHFPELELRPVTDLASPAS